MKQITRLLIGASILLGTTVVSGEEPPVVWKYDGELHRLNDPDLAKAFWDVHPIGVYGIWPSEEEMRRALPAEKVQKEYLLDVAKRLRKVLNDPLLPSPPTTETAPGKNDSTETETPEKVFKFSEWYAIPKLRFRRNYILGRFASGDTTLTALIEFQASADDLGIKVSSKTLFPYDPQSVTAEQLKAVINRVLRYPRGKADKVVIDKQFARLGKKEVPVCFGKAQCEYDVDRPGAYSGDHGWWSYILFWYAKGVLFIGTLTEETSSADASPPDAWVFPDVPTTQPASRPDSAPAKE